MIKHYFLPQSLDEALALLKEHGEDVAVSGGGTHMMMLINNGHIFPRALMGLRRAGLANIHANGSLRIGAMSTMTQIMQADTGDLLHTAAQNVGGWAVRNMATVGGNLMMPQPAGDFAVALLALGADVKLAGPDGERLVPLVDFYASLPHLKTGELITEIIVPHSTGKTAYLKHARREANAPSMVTVAVNLEMDGGTVTAARIALNGAGATPVRATAAERVVTGQALEPQTIAQAAKAAAEECSPFDDAVASAWYRRKMVDVFVKRALEAIV
ncbi:MAG: FAD binding domain-containing protein [Chloroflexota bacterium]